MLDPEFVLDSAARERLLDRFGPDAKPWCDGLAGLVTAYSRRWGLELDEALSGGTSRVFLGRQDGARPVALKLTPDRSIAESEAIALRAWARTPHAVDLIESDPEAGVLLLDRVTPGAKVAARPGLPSFEEFAELLAGIRAADGQDVATLRSSAEGVEFIYGLIARRARDSYVSRFVSSDTVARGHALARELTASADDSGLVHGDLHLSNILDGGPARGLVAIDPRSSVGDRTWDAIDIALARVTSADELDDRISRITALVPGLNAGRLRQWCQATAVISVVQRLFYYRHDGAVPDKTLLDLAASAYKRLKVGALGRLADHRIRPHQVIGAAWPMLGELGQLRLERIELLGPYPRRPTTADLVEERLADRHHLVAMWGHPQPFEARVARVGLPLHVSELLEDGDRLRGGLLGDRQPTSEFRGGVRSPIDGAEGEFIARTDARVSAVGQLSPHIVGHRVKAVEQQQGKLDARRSRHEGNHTGPRTQWTSPLSTAYS
jgi:streptomycin 6-kinase